MKLHYYPDTDSLYVEFQNRPSTDTREISADVRLDIDDQGRPVGLDIDHASTVLDLDTLETQGLPVTPTSRQQPGVPSSSQARQTEPPTVVKLPKEGT